MRVPSDFSPTWEREGIQQALRHDMGWQSGWLIQLLARVPLKHWQERFERSPK